MHHLEHVMAQGVLKPKPHSQALANAENSKNTRVIGKSAFLWRVLLLRHSELVCQMNVRKNNPHSLAHKNVWNIKHTWVQDGQSVLIPLSLLEDDRGQPTKLELQGQVRQIFILYKTYKTNAKP